MTGLWTVKLRGGAYDGFGGKAPEEPPPVIVAFRHPGRCSGHVSFDPFAEQIVIATAESYRRTEFDPETRVAVYDVGESSGGPGVEEREVVGVGGGLVPA